VYSLSQEVEAESGSEIKRISQIFYERTFQLVILAVVIYTIIFSYLTILKYFSFQTTGDLGVFDQAMWTTLHGYFLYDTPELGTHLRIHFDPMLLLLLPIYDIYPSPLTLLFLQSLFLALGAIPVYLLSKYELGSGYSALVFALLYLIYPPMQGVNWFDFHPECLAPVLLISAFYCLKKEKYLWYFVFVFLALTCKEIIAPIVAFMGLYGFWINRRKIINYFRSSPKGLLSDRLTLVSALTLILGVVWYIVAVRIMASLTLTQTYSEFGAWSYLGESFEGVLYTAITNPFYVLQIALTPFSSKAFYLFVLLGPLAFVSLLNPMSLLISTPWLAASLLSLLPNHYTPVGLQYPAVLVPFIFISAIYGAKTLQPAVKRAFSYLDKERSNRLLNSRVMHKIAKKNVEKPLLLILIILSVTGVFFFWSYKPMTAASSPNYNIRDQVLESVAQLIPPYALVATQPEIFSHIDHNPYAYPMYIEGIPYEYILVDNLSPSYYIPLGAPSDVPVTIESFSSVVPNLISSGQYGVVISINGIMLLVRGYSGQPLIQI
jgi:uncharacterized membrane protein